MELDINCSLANNTPHHQAFSVDAINAGYFNDPSAVGTFDALYRPYVQEWYPTYIPYWNESSLEKAFKLVQKLITKKFVKEPKTVKDFIELVNVLAEEL